MDSSTVYNLPSKLVRQRSRGVVYNTPPPLPLIALSPDDEWEEFDTPTQTGFGYSLPHVEQLDDPALHREAPQTAGVVAPEAARRCRLLSEYMTSNEFFQTPRHGFGLETRLVYKRNKERESAALDLAARTRHAEDLGFSATFESGNLDRAYRVLGRRYASSHELHMLRGGSRPAPAAKDSARPASAAPTSTSTATAPPVQEQTMPFPFFADVELEYDLYADVDMNTLGHIQWYLFRVTVSSVLLQQTRERGATSLKVRFNLRNMLKRASLYNDGMLPAVFLDGGVGPRGWHHAGINVCYFKNAETYRHRRTGKMQNFYTLSFVYEFVLSSSPPAAGSGAGDESVVAYFAHCYPYTYTRLQRFMLEMQKDPARNRNFRRRVLCKTIAGNNCDLLTITDFSQECDAEERNTSSSISSSNSTNTSSSVGAGGRRTAIILSARVHPGESNSSFLMHGILNFLTGDSLEARFLRHHFVFKVVPMLNPDGVIHGNYRCSLAGTDLNRRWLNPSSELHPTVFATKNMILSVRRMRPISLYVDLHGHSRKKNIFLYGCRPFDAASRSEAARVRLFPHILCKTSDCTRGGFYSFSDCTFSVSSSKKSTGRVVVWNEAQVLHSFTLEASFFGIDPTTKKSSMQMQMQPQPQSSTPDNNNLRVESGIGSSSTPSLRHLTPADLQIAGLKVCHALLPFSQVLDLQLASAPTPVAPVPRAPPLVATVPPGSPTRGSSRSLLVLETPAANGTTATGSVSSADKSDTTESQPLVACSSPSPGVAAVDATGANKIRLAPLQPSPRNLSTESDGVAPWESPQKTSPPRLEPVPNLQPSAVDSVSPSTFSFALPPEFDQLFAGGEMSSMLSLLDQDDLIREIEAALPDTLQDNPEEDGSIGSESDPSGDNMEEEEMRHAAPSKDVAPPPLVQEEAATVSPVVPRSRPPRIMRHRSEPRIPEVVVLKKNPAAPEAAIAAPEPVQVRTRANRPVTPKSTLPLGPLKKAPSNQRLALFRNAPHDRNREIAALHLYAVQRRSQTRRTLRQNLSEVEEHL